MHNTLVDLKVSEVGVTLAVLLIVEEEVNLKVLSGREPVRSFKVLEIDHSIGTRVVKQDRNLEQG